MKLIAEDLKPDILERIDSIRRYMKEDGIEAALVASNANIYYTTSRFFRGYVYIPLAGDPVWFVIRPVGFDEEKDVAYIRKPEMIPAGLTKLGLPLPESIGLEYGALTYSDVMRLKALFPQARQHDCLPALRKARMVKTRWELDRMHEDGVHQAEAYRRVTRCYREDMTDLEFQIEIERILRLEGNLGFMRTSGNLMEINMGSVIAGDNADVPSPYDFTMGGAGVDPSLPGGANGKTLRRGETVMVDMSGSFNGYQTDMTRVWRLGEISALALRAHECSRSILRECEKMGRPGVKVAELYDKAIEIAKGEGFDKYFMGHRQQAPFIGHGIGIELNELPVVTSRSHDVLALNMTIALEPKFVIPGVGAVGVENTYVVTDNGLKALTVFPEEIQEL
ncbi:MAG: Xaa-Pro peptidase family protein [Muribaculaceae bacterium]|nr:Xaa-Pro peptidase family protein [Muribaculaceae bacterium]